MPASRACSISWPARVGRSSRTLPGTTRDVLTETIDVDGVPMTIVDTAGVRREPGDEIEAEGIARAVAAREAASLTVLVLDRSTPMTDDDQALIDETTGRPRVVVANKIDLAPAWNVDGLGVPVIELSARTGPGVEALRRALTGAAQCRNAARHACRDQPAARGVARARA